MDPLSLMSGLVTTAVKIKATLDVADSNKHMCKLLKSHIEMVMNTAEARLKEKADQKEELQAFVKEMGDILEDTEKVVEGIKKTNSLMKKMKAKDHDEKLQRMIDRLDLLHKQAAFLTLAKLYEEDRITKASPGHSWDISYEEVCLFCHITKDGNILIGGQREERGEEWWELKAYDNKGNEKWHWQCAPEIGQPSDVTKITVDGKDYLALLLEDLNKIVLFDKEINSLVRDNDYNFSQQGYRIRRIVAMDAQRLVVSADPTVAAGPSHQSQLLVLSCRKLPFSQRRTIPLECLDIHSLSRVSRDQVAVVCGRPESVHVFDVDSGHSKWHLEPAQIKGREILPQGVCAVGGDICVYDGTGRRIVMASGGKWGEVLISKTELGECVYSTAYSPTSKKLVVLHEEHDGLRITLFDLK